MKTKVLGIILPVLFSANIYGQIRECDYCGVPYIADSIIVYDTVIVRDTVYISTLDDITKYFDLTFDQYVERYLLFAKKDDTFDSPSTDMVYLNYFLPMLEDAVDLTKKRWIMDVFSIYAIQDNLSIKQTPLLFSDSIDGVNGNVDILIKCEGGVNTSYFLESQKMIDQCLIEIFRYVYSVNTASPNKIGGMNFYFPQFMFKDKRAMAQFAKALHLIVGKSSLSAINSVKLYFSFDKNEGLANTNYLNCITSMVDSVMLIDSNGHEVFSEISTLNRNDHTVSFFHKMKNQIYLASFSMEKYFLANEYDFNPAEILNMAHNDHAENNWEFYFLILCSILGLTVITAILYWVVPVFSYYLNKNSDYMIMLILMFIIETILLVFIMFEAMSRDNVFNFSNKNMNYILFMPLILVLLTPLIKLVGNNKPKP